MSTCSYCLSSFVKSIGALISSSWCLVGLLDLLNEIADNKLSLNLSLKWWSSYSDLTWSWAYYNWSPSQRPKKKEQSIPTRRADTHNSPKSIHQLWCIGLGSAKSLCNAQDNATTFDFLKLLSGPSLVHIIWFWNNEGYVTAARVLLASSSEKLLVSIEFSHRHDEAYQCETLRF